MGRTRHPEGVYIVKVDECSGFPKSVPAETAHFDQNCLDYMGVNFYFCHRLTTKIIRTSKYFSCSVSKI